MHSSNDKERTRNRDGQTDRQTDNGAKNNISPYFMKGDIITESLGYNKHTFYIHSKSKV